MKLTDKFAIDNDSPKDKENKMLISNDAKAICNMIEHLINKLSNLR